MTEQQRGLILLIKSALTGEKYDLPEAFDVDAAFDTAKRHGVTVMAYYGAHNCGVDTSCEVMKKSLGEVYRSMMVTERQNAEIARILSAFDENKIDYMPLKGIHLRSLYPKPEMRRMGDADILIKTEQYDKIRGIMQGLGFVEGEAGDYEVHWHSASLLAELHNRLLDSNNKDFYEYFGDGWKYALKISEKVSRYEMTTEDEFIYLFTHFARHYRDAGIGIRHFTDIWVYKKNNGNLDENYLEIHLKKLKLFEFYRNICRAFEVWFNGAECDEKSDFITDIIFFSGEFGKKSASILSNTLKEKKSEKSVALIRQKRLLGRIFCGKKELYSQYPMLEKACVLYPFIWLVYLFKRVFQKNKVKNYAMNYLTVTDAKVTDYQKALNFVGLDYNFE